MEALLTFLTVTVGFLLNITVGLVKAVWDFLVIATPSIKSYLVFFWFNIQQLYAYIHVHVDQIASASNVK